MEHVFQTYVHSSDDCLTWPYSIYSRMCYIYRDNLYTMTSQIALFQVDSE